MWHSNYTERLGVGDTAFANDVSTNITVESTVVIVQVDCVASGNFHAVGNPSDIVVMCAFDSDGTVFHNNS